MSENDFNAASPYDVLLNHSKLLENILWPMVEKCEGLTAVEIHSLHTAFLALQVDCMRIALEHSPNKEAT